MNYYALITVDVHSLDEGRRATFYKQLEKEGWIKLDNLSTAWSKEIYDLSLSTSYIQNLVEKNLNSIISRELFHKTYYAILVSSIPCKEGSLK